MTGVENMDLGVRHILAVAFRLAGIERERSLLTPDHQEARLFLAHPCLPFRVGLHIGAIVVKQIALDLAPAPADSETRTHPSIDQGRSDRRSDRSHMARPRRLQRQEICAKCAFVRRPIFPKLAPRLPIRAEAFVVCDCVLNNKSFNALRMGKCHAKTDGAAVILHVKRVAREPERFGEVIHDLGEVIERVREFFRIGPIAVSEARVIGRDKMKAIGKPGEERLEHPG